MAAVDENKKSAYHRLHTATAYDWEADRNRRKDITDDGTMSFFWQAHTITVLVIFSCILVYVAIFEVPSSDNDYNMKRGITAAVLAFLLFGVIQTPDGPFKRPHPAFWRLILCLSIVYELALVYLLFQSVHSARLLMKHFDSSLGKPLPEKDYGGNCLIYDPDATDPWHNLWDKLDLFVPVHFFGWWGKTLVLRDWWLCMVLSIMFEVLEYTLEHQLPNFSECWWDHWIMDIAVCNSFGIYLGMKTLNYLSMKPYHWRGMWNIPTYRFSIAEASLESGRASGGSPDNHQIQLKQQSLSALLDLAVKFCREKIKRLALQFTPYSWTDFNWQPTSSLRRWLAMILVIAMFLLAELNTFYLKFVLWLPPEHYLCSGRLAFFVFSGAVSMRETFQYLDDPNCKKFGRQSWLLAAIIITELLIIFKFDWETVTKPLPPTITIFWVCGFLLLCVYTVWKFYIKKDVKNDIKLLEEKQDYQHQSDSTEAEGPTNYAKNVKSIARSRFKTEIR